MDERISQPWAYEFYQMVRLLELDSLRHQQAMAVAANASTESDVFSPFERIQDDERVFPVGEGASPRQEPVRFRVNPAMTFHPAAIKSVEVGKRGVSRTRAAADKKRADVSEEGLTESDHQWHVAVNVMGLIGATGVLPFRYSELVIQRLRAKDPAMKAFFDVFNHRTLSLLYRAWKKYRPAYAFETDNVAQRHKNERASQANAFSLMMAGLCGLSQENTAFNRPEGAWLNYAGVTAHRRCNEYTLKNVIRHHFGINVQIHQFKGRWQRLDPDVVTRLAGGMQLGMNNQLGQNALLGEKCWVAQNLFEIEVIDLDEAQLAELSPGSRKLQALYEFVKQRAGIEMDFDLSLKIKEKDLPVAQLGRSGEKKVSNEKERQSLLGWNTRLHNANPSERKIRISISKYGMQYKL